MKKPRKKSCRICSKLIVGRSTNAVFCKNCLGKKWKYSKNKIVKNRILKNDTGTLESAYDSRWSGELG